MCTVYDTYTPYHPLTAAMARAVTRAFNVEIIQIKSTHTPLHEPHVVVRWRTPQSDMGLLYPQEE